MNLRRACPECGRRWAGDARFCGDCGGLLPTAARSRQPGAKRRVDTPLAIVAGGVAVVVLVVAGVTSAANLERDASSGDGPTPDATSRSAGGQARDEQGISVHPADGAGGATPEPGSVIWRRRIEPGSRVSAGAVTLYVQTGDGVAAIDRATGALRWHAADVAGTPLDPLPAGIPVIGDDAVLRVLQATDGVTRWSVDGLRPTAPNAVTAGAFVVTADPDGLVSYAARGRLAWELDGVEPGWFGQPASGRGLLFVITDDVLVALHPLTGAVAWRTDLPRLVGPVAVVGDTVVARDDGDRLHGLDLRSGAVRWSQAGVTGTAVVADGVVAVRSASTPAAVVRFEPGTGRQLGSVVVDGEVLDLLDLRGELVAVTSEGIRAFRPTGALSWELDLDGPVRQLLPGGELVLAVTDREILWVVAAQRGTNS